MFNNKIGIDICFMARIKIDNRSFLSRFLHPDELKMFDTFESKKRQREYAAGRWAIKEAMYKAYNFKINFNEILIGDNGEGPYVESLNDLPNYSLSLSHDNEYCVAVAVASFDKITK